MLSDHLTFLKDRYFLRHASLMEPFDIGLDGKEIEALPDFDDLPAEPPKKKIRWENQQRKRKGLLDKKIQGLSLDELT